MMTRIFAAFLLGMFITLGAVAAQPVYQTDEGAIRGYDPVAYFVAGKPVKGSKEFTHQWNGASWYFSSAGNRDLFKSAPEKYAPQYGGY